VAEAEIDEGALKREARYDGKCVLLTDCDLPAEEVALAYKGLWRVEAAFREPEVPLRVTRHGFWGRSTTGPSGRCGRMWRCVSWRFFWRWSLSGG
jgi:hypothetical protein